MKKIVEKSRFESMELWDTMDRIVNCELYHISLIAQLKSATVSNLYNCIITQLQLLRGQI
jgi:hypothetical protein